MFISQILRLMLKPGSADKIYLTVSYVHTDLVAPTGSLIISEQTHISDGGNGTTCEGKELDGLRQLL